MVLDSWNVVYRVTFKDFPNMNDDFDTKDEALEYAKENLDKNPVVTGKEIYVDENGGTVSEEAEQVIFYVNKEETAETMPEESDSEEDEDENIGVGDDAKLAELEKSVDSDDFDRDAITGKIIDTVEVKDEEADDEKDEISEVSDESSSDSDDVVAVEDDMDDYGFVDKDDIVPMKDVYPSLANALDLDFDDLDDDVCPDGLCHKDLAGPEDFFDDVEQDVECDDDSCACEDEIPAVSTDLVVKVPLEDHDIDDIADEDVDVAVKFNDEDDKIEEELTDEELSKELSLTDDDDDDAVEILEEDTHPTGAQPEVDHKNAYNKALEIAKQNGKPVIYGYLGSDHHGSRRAYELSEPIVCDDLEKCTKDAMSKYHPAGSLYIAYPDKSPLKEAADIDLTNVSADTRKHLDIADKFRKKLGQSPIYRESEIQEYYRHNQVEVEDDSTVEPNKDVPVKSCKEYPLVTHDEDDMSDIELAQKLEEARQEKLKKVSE